MTYKLFGAGVVVIATGMNIPLPANESYGWQYEEWRAAGGAPLPADVPSLAELRDLALTGIRIQRAALFLTLAGLQSEALARNNTVEAMAIANLQQGMRDITQLNLSAFTTKAQIDAAFVAAWAVLITVAPQTAKQAFTESKK